LSIPTEPRQAAPSNTAAVNVCCAPPAEQSPAHTLTMESQAGSVQFSLIMPTRHRTERLRSALDSIKATTKNLARLEVVLVIDEDDEESVGFRYDGVPLKRVQVRSGLTMGALNMAGYRAATGSYLMLLNDDVISRTPGWDEQVLEAFRSCPDGMVLVHVNDLLFKDTLCIFPFVTRDFCLLTGGICDEGYFRYRIDDHIHNIFDLLTLLGHPRRIFLPDVVFEHTNTHTSEGGEVHYEPDRAIHDVDTHLFDSYLAKRKKIAVEALCRIEGRDYSVEHQSWEAKLAPITDSVAIRRPEHARWFVTSRSSFHHPPRVTVGIVSADSTSLHAQECIRRVKTYTSNFDLILIDNNRDTNFNHSREMNRLLSICRTDYLALLDDDVLVGPGWLQGMLRCFTPGVGVVTPLHMGRDASLSYAGIVLDPTDSGHHSHILEVPSGPRRIQTLCSAAMLIHIPACGHVRLDERYTKYFLDIDYGLQVWEAGMQVVCSPYSEVTHLAGATMEQGGPRSVQLFEEQRLRYVDSWRDSGRIHALRQHVWPAIPEIACIDQIAGKIDRLLEQGATSDRNQFMQEATASVPHLAAYPFFKDHMARRVRKGLGDRQVRVDDPNTGHLAFLLGLTGLQPVLFEEGHEGMNIVLHDSRYFALPQTEGVFSWERMIRNGYSRSFEADSPETLKALILSYRDLPAQGHVASAGGSASPRRLERPAGRTSYSNPLAHYLEIGAYEGRNPNPLFDSAYYLAENPDVSAAGKNPLAHFLECGASQGRRPNPLFDTAYYLEQNPDASAAGMNPLQHFLEVGSAAGRKPNPDFDPVEYLRRNPDVAASGVNPLAHFLARTNGGVGGSGRSSAASPDRDRKNELGDVAETA
jgi:GT2 family glycosyltransferase